MTRLPTPSATLRWLGLCATILFMAACESTPETGLPTAPTPPSPAPRPGSGYHTLSGIVTAAGRPAAGARVTVLEMVPELSATTDSDGRYSIRDVPTSTIWGRTLVRFSHPGYFTDFQRPSIVQDTRLDAALDPLVFISPGEIVRGTVVSIGGWPCSGKEYEPAKCERFAVIAPATGTLDVTLSSNANAGSWWLDVVNPAGEAIAQFHGSPKHIDVPAIAGGTYEIRVAADAAVEFELTTSMR